MEISEKGIKAIKAREGEVLYGYRDSAKLLTIGVGHLVKVGEPYKLGEYITEEESTRLLKQDLTSAEECVNRIVKVQLNQNQFDALVSLAFNIGNSAIAKSSLIRKLNAGDYKGAADGFLAWNRAGGQVSRGLIKRRNAERQQFLSPTEEPAVNLTDTNPAKSMQEITNLANSQSSGSTTSSALSSTTETGKVEIRTEPGQAASEEAVKVSGGNKLINWLVGSITTGSLGTVLWSWFTNHLDNVAVICICITILALAIIFRRTIIDYVSMNSHADPYKYNVK